MLSECFHLPIHCLYKSEPLSFLFRYLPGDYKAFKREEQWEGTFLLYATKPVIKHILQWVVLCALKRPCIAPISNRWCNFQGGDTHNHYVNCHRFDQSAFSITMLNYFNRSSWSYYGGQTKIVKIERFSTGKYLLSDDCYEDRS